MTSKTLLIDNIRIDGNTQARCAINQDTVAEYAALFAEDEYELPEPIVFFDGSNNWLADGFHRYFAHRAAGKGNIIVERRKGTQRDAILYSLNANTVHGLRPSAADKRKAVGTMLADAEWSEMSDRAIGRHCGVSHTFVAKLRCPEPVAAPKAPASSGNVATPEASAPVEPSGNVATPAVKTESEQAAEDAHGDDDPIALLEAAHQEIAELRALLAVAEQDDQKKETLKYKRIADLAVRRQNELMDTVNAREAELKRQMNTIRRICKAAGEDDPTKVAAVVEAAFRAKKVTA